MHVPLVLVLTVGHVLKLAVGRFFATVLLDFLGRHVRQVSSHKLLCSKHVKKFVNKALGNSESAGFYVTCTLKKLAKRVG